MSISLPKKTHPSSPKSFFPKLCRASSPGTCCRRESWGLVQTLVTKKPNWGTLSTATAGPLLIPNISASDARWAHLGQQAASEDPQSNDSNPGGQATACLVGEAASPAHTSVEGRCDSSPCLRAATSSVHGTAQPCLSWGSTAAARGHETTEPSLFCVPGVSQELLPLVGISRELWWCDLGRS